MLNKSASATEWVREARDMRERRDATGLDYWLVSPVPPFPLVSRANMVFSAAC
jgi:hypothetical protein